MNKVLKLALSADTSDRDIAKELVSKDKELQRHFINIALYTGPRGEINTAASFRRPFEKKGSGDGAYNLYCAVYNSLPSNAKKKIETYQEDWEKSNQGKNIYALTKTGWWYTEALKSLKILMKE